MYLQLLHESCNTNIQLLAGGCLDLSFLSDPREPACFSSVPTSVSLEGRDLGVGAWWEGCAPLVKMWPRQWVDSRKTRLLPCPPLRAFRLFPEDERAEKGKWWDVWQSAHTGWVSPKNPPPCSLSSRSSEQWPHCRLSHTQTCAVCFCFPHIMRMVSSFSWVRNAERVQRESQGSF